jgi:hypothetical protein
VIEAVVVVVEVVVEGEGFLQKLFNLLLLIVPLYLLL